MTWTYLPQLLQEPTPDGQMMRVRFLIGDTDAEDHQLHDEEILFINTHQPVTTYAAAAAADTLAAKYARQVNTNNSDLRVSAAARHKHYQELADRLRSMGAGEVPGGEGAGEILAEVYVGGASKTASDSILGDSGLNKSPFAVGQDDLLGNPNRK